MKRSLFSLSTLLALAILIAASFAGAQQTPAQDRKLKGYFLTSKPNKPAHDLLLQRLKSPTAVNTTSVPLWPYGVSSAYDGNPYQGMMVGRSPIAHGHRTTTIPTVLVPLKMTFSDSGETFDASAANVCSPNGGSVASLIAASPLFQPVAFTMNGTSVGTVQYLDGFQRGSFWNFVKGTPYHTVFTSSPTIHAPVSVTVAAAHGSTQLGFCSDFGEVDNAWFDAYVQSTILPALAAEGWDSSTFPQLLLDSVVQYENNDPNLCCVLGYHGSFTDAGNILHTYSLNDFDNSGAFGGDTSVMVHEIGEWMDDPDGGNPVPNWGAEGQVTAGNCQGNLEVGDPLSPNYPTPTNPYLVTMPNGVTYTLQELAFFNWFFGLSPNFGVGNDYSSHGTFTGHAAACPPGGTT